MTIQHLPFCLERKGERPIHGKWHLPRDNAKGTVLFLHGYKGHMDWGAWPQVGDAVAQSGWRFLRINFTHNGTAPDHPTAFVDLAGFAANTHRRELEEAHAVVTALRTPTPENKTGTHQGPLAIIGHSRGGGIACLTATEANAACLQRKWNGVSHLITWASVADFNSRFPKGDALLTWEKEGQMEVINHRTRQRLHHDWRFYSDFQSHAQRLNIQRAMEQYPGPSLIVHAADDPAVPLSHAHQLSGWSQNPTLFITTDGAHTFGAREPWIESALPAPLKGVMQTTLRFLEEGRAVS